LILGIFTSVEPTKGLFSPFGADSAGRLPLLSRLFKEKFHISVSASLHSSRPDLTF